MPHPLPLQLWISRLESDALCDGYLDNLNLLGNHILALFWEAGCEPTVSAMLDNCEDKVA